MYNRFIQRFMNLGVMVKTKILVLVSLTRIIEAKKKQKSEGAKKIICIIKCHLKPIDSN